VLESWYRPGYAQRMSGNGDNGGPPVAVLDRLRRGMQAVRGRDIGIRAVRIGADRLFVDTVDRYLAAMAWKFRLREGAAQRFIERELGPGMVAVDVGANVGCFTLALARRVGSQGRVYAIEPEGRCFELLGRAVGARHLAHVEARQVAVADYSGWTTLYVATVDHGDHRLVPADEERRAVTVRAVSLDDLLADAPRVDLIKISVQGAEVSALRGLARTLARRPAPPLLCSVSPALLERNGAAADAFFAPLHSAGYAAHRLRSDGSSEAVPSEVAWSLARARGRALFCFRPT
jgi:FkbM family methyltransferase